jgi:protein-serine/threonine kinase
MMQTQDFASATGSSESSPVDDTTPKTIPSPLPASDSATSSTSDLAETVNLPSPTDAEIVYGVRSEDPGDEVRFSVELTRLDGLMDTYCLDIRRLKGNLKSYKFIYDLLRE